MTISQLFSFREKLTKMLKMWKINNFLYSAAVLYHVLYPLSLS